MLYVTWLKIKLIRGWVQFGPANLKEQMEELEGVYGKLRKRWKKIKCEFQIKEDDKLI